MMSRRAEWDRGEIRCPRCGGDVGFDVTFCPECGLRLRHDGADHAEGASGRPWIVIGLAVGGLAAIVIGGAIALALSGPGDVGLVTATPGFAVSPSQSLTIPPPSARSSPAPTARPTATPVPTPVPNAAIPNRAIADVQVDQLNLRAAGNDSAEILGQLRAGARVFTIGAPTETGGVHWYRVAVASGPYSGGPEYCQGDPYCEADIGWVASPITGNPWLEAVEVGCPSSPMSIDDLDLLTPMERLQCFGNEDIIVTGTIDHPCCGWMGPIRYDPAWLAAPSAEAMFHAARLHPRFDPDSHVDVPERGSVIRATAHFDDPAAPDCRQSVDPEFEPEDVMLQPTAWVVLECRMQLVVTDYEVVGTEDLGPCCGVEPPARRAAVAPRDTNVEGRRAPPSPVVSGVTEDV